ncbi:hypothetical protein Misp01_38860 [Microtetraspora sp. NBRC 13810]|uniref:hypothetical protein n=1 Tax=Microtetraspora sp. NBRC 13810 TaxID=3030990 RepID=UPI0025521579|nr:hypothetical protein [Microtetraspora sp. NBRC 13810]GLW08756.1 hypothetical protein Misp01_38860 [Microtetraspora sp. NBRC 13810]
MPLSVKVARNLIWFQATLALVSIVLLIPRLEFDPNDFLEDLLYVLYFLPPLAAAWLANQWHTRRPRVRHATIAVQLAIPLLDFIYFLIEGTLDWVFTAPWSALIVTLLLLSPARTWFAPALQIPRTPSEPAPPAAS